MEPPSGRLDGWKAIAAHLGRDERTAQRWRHRGLPVHAVPGGKKGTVFAYADELDGWMTQEAPAVRDEPHGPPLHDQLFDPPPHDDTSLGEHGNTPLAENDAQRFRWTGATRVLTLTGVLGLAAGVGLALVPDSAPRTGDLIGRAEVTPGGLVAWRPDGQAAFSVANHHLFPADVPAGTTGVIEARKTPLVMDLDADGSAEVIVLLGFAEYGPRLSEEVRAYDADGSLRWRYQLAGRLRFGGRDFDGPWRATDQLVTRDTDGRARLWLTIIHDVWWPSFVLSLDAHGAAKVHLVHSGHLYAMANVPTTDGNRLVMTGVNNEYKSAVMVALDPRGPAATSPRESATFTCEGCADGPPARYLLLPQSELSLLEGRAYNQGKLVGALRSLTRVSVDEVPDLQLSSHYTLSRGLEPLSVEMSDQYWAHHHLLEARGLIAHTADQCPERRGRTVRSWTAEGWHDVWVPGAMPRP